ncbi:CopG family transcriptional regulator [Streptomyces sp. NPDC059637]|uniref:ribbon-helix-helix domain-containing protein n=1 Tax=Streptomyces sp. NPDC059637 TaxID=3347752 RepID=UPI0036CA1536
MALKRTMVYADPDDLATIKEAARREGVSEAEIIREAIHLAALAKRRWNEPLTWVQQFDSGESAPLATADAAAEVWDDRARAYEDTKKRGGSAA